MVRCHFIRQKFILCIIFCCSATYFIVKTTNFMQHSETDEIAFLESLKLRAPKSIKWQADNMPTTASSVNFVKCKNTKQGGHWITDEKGYTCQRSELDEVGCCPASNSSYFSCNSCQNNTQCCAIYEFCVSCCLHPDRRDLLEHIINETTGSRLRALLAVKDQFDLCQLKCRTSSSSVHLENKYKNSNLKYCYGHEPKLPY